MSVRGFSIPAAAFCFLFLAAPRVPAEESTSQDLNYSSEAIAGAVLDLIYPGQETAGGSLGTDQKSGSTKGDAQNLQGEVIDLKAAGADVQETASEIKISLQGEILFDFDKATLRPVAEPTLIQIAALIKKNAKSTTSVEGHTDSKGANPYNLKLSERRAASVKTWLASHGVPAGAIQTKGFGASKPIAPNNKADGSDDPEGRQKNRRVEITIKK